MTRPALPRSSSSASGFFFLRHQAGARRVGVGKLDEAKLLRAVDDQVLPKLGEVGHQQRAPERQLDDEVAVRDAVDGVGHRPREAEVVGEGLAVDAKRVAGEGARSEGQLVHALGDLRQPLAVAPPRRRVRQHPVRPPDRLRRLEVCVARHQEVRLRRGALGGGLHE